MTNYRVILRSETGHDLAGVPVEVRLRKFLKAALRAYGLRCIAVTASDDDGEPVITVARTASPLTVAPVTTAGHAGVVQVAGMRHRDGLTE